MISDDCEHLHGFLHNCGDSLLVLCTALGNEQDVLIQFL